MTDIHPELFDLSISKKAEPLLSAVKKHIAENVIPWVNEYHELRKKIMKTLGVIIPDNWN